MYFDNKIIIIELNEFNKELLENAVKEINLPNIANIISFHSFTYKTNDTYESGYLEPWVQWNSVHLGMPSTEHKVKNLGETSVKFIPSMWNRLSENGISTGIFGCMNASRNRAIENKFFMPDPWMHSEPGYPKCLSNLLMLPRYLAKNYRDISILKFFKLLPPFFKSLFDLRMTMSAISITFLSIYYRFIRKKKDYVFIVLYDILTSSLFCKLIKNNDSNVNVIFLNSLAHIQHHYWNNINHISDEIKWSLKKIDVAIGKITDSYPGAAFVFHNGLSQLNTNDDKPWIGYRQKNPEQFYQAIGIEGARVEQNMTHDGHLIFNDQQKADDAFKILISALINKEKLFHLEKKYDNEFKIFYRLDITDDLAASSKMFCNHKEYNFFDLFDRIVMRTGKHMPIGTIYSNKINFSGIEYNHQFNSYIYKYLGLPEHADE